jgi:hypothetical protein
MAFEKWLLFELHSNPVTKFRHLDGKNLLDWKNETKMSARRGKDMSTVLD